MINLLSNLDPVMGESAVCFSHFVRLFAFADS
jgi:hypothetical protein